MRTPVAFAFAALAAPAAAFQEVQQPLQVRQTQQDEARARIAMEAGDEARAVLADPALLQRVGDVPPRGRWLRLLEDAGLALRVFERDSEGDLALGFSYDLAKPLGVGEGAETHVLDLVARGRVAFENDANPDDHLETGLRMRWSGTRALGSAAETRAELARELANPEPEALATLDAETFGRLAARAPSLSDEELRADPDLRALAVGHAETVLRTLPPELLWDCELHAIYESDQNFSSRQVALGASAGGRLLSWDPDAAASRYNLFDYPAAALRWLAGADEEFRASGRAYPTLVAGFDVVDASRDDARGAVTESETFLRARLEARMTSPLVELGAGTVDLRAAFRAHQEFDAPASVRRADLDDARQLEIALDLPRGWSLSYATGRLPIDPHDDSTFALALALGR